MKPFSAFWPITHRKWMLREAQNRLIQSEKLAALGQLIAGVAHELNNPLSSVILHADLLKLRYQDKTLEPKLTRITNDAHRAAAIVKQLLDFSRQRSPERKQIDVNKLLAETVDLLNYNLRTHNIEVITQLQLGAPTILADPHQLQQVFINLLTNAQQAIHAQSNAGKLTVSTHYTAVPNVPITIEIHDTGPGIPAHLQSRVFDPFFTTKKAGEGTGLGLAVCHGIIAEHGGSITLHSQAGEGTTFVIQLPVQPYPPTAVTAAVAPPPQTPTTTNASPQTKHILIIDDEENLRQIMANILELNNYQVTAVDNGRVGLAQLKTTDYDLILCDINMPDINGREVFDWLTHNMAHYLNRLIFVTGDVLQKETRSFLENANVPCLHKPFNIDDLVAAVTNKLNESSAT